MTRFALILVAVVGISMMSCEDESGLPSSVPSESTPAGPPPVDPPPPPPPPPPPSVAATVFSSAIGTKWFYTYTSHAAPLSFPPFGGYVRDRRASICWTIASSDSVNDSLVCRITVTGQDTLHTTHYEYGLVVSDTTTRNAIQAEWRMVHYRDRVILNWYSSLVPAYYFDHTVLRSSIEAVDTLKIGDYVYAGTEYFVQGVGLVRFVQGQASQSSGWSEQELKLTSWSKPTSTSVPLH